jgi:hypothetical protein
MMKNNNANIAGITSEEIQPFKFSVTEQGIHIFVNFTSVFPEN